ncbi:hypothetical protein [Vallitalea guaymasensis]|uniref:hypothetical protein n=1 Tax=Vallitalea guaymasensis TaxID=1185412 RepID=UPI000DE4AA1D|nr:hypothetical protein [Vallitalea guaymasensis]
MDKIRYTEYQHTMTKELGYIASYSGQVVAVIEGTKKVTNNLSKAERFMEKNGYIKKAGATNEQAG